MAAIPKPLELVERGAFVASCIRWGQLVAPGPLCVCVKDLHPRLYPIPAGDIRGLQTPCINFTAPNIKNMDPHRSVFRRQTK